MGLDPLKPPVDIRLTVLGDVQCPYLPDQIETIRAVMASSIDGATYRAFMDVGFRRSGRMLYQPVCRTCNACVPLRVLAEEFSPSKSQRRVQRKNHDLLIDVGRPDLTQEKFELYARYVHDWHARPEEAEIEALRTFLYDSPTDTVEFTYRDAGGKLVAVGICDVSPTSLSSVYFYFDPAESKRSLGTFGALAELDWCKRKQLPHYYLGYWIADCQAMAYKAGYTPHETLEPSGIWQRSRADEIVLP